MRNSSVGPAIATICAWLIPGWGYYLIGERGRGMTAGAGVIGLFLAGILVGGIRVMDPPGWGEYGYMVMLVQRFDRGRQRMEMEYSRVDPSSSAQASDPADDEADRSAGPALMTQPLSELSDKPWYVGQILCGPITLLASAMSVHAAHPSAANPTQETWPSSHSRSWEIGTLYTAVAGMLNLLVIIDSAHRAAQRKIAPVAA